MNLLSITLFSWLVVTAVLTWFVPRKYSSHFIALSTILFLYYFAGISLLILLLSTLFVYFFTSRSRANAAILLTLIAFIASVFVYFKIRSDSNMFGGGVESLIPLGLSYYTFRQIHYIFEKIKGKLPVHSFPDYLLYIFFLPTFIVGPINRFPQFLRDLRRRRPDQAYFSSGLERIVYGYAKIIILADFLVNLKLQFLLNQNVSETTFLYAYLQSWIRWMNLYFQFSGYSDIAIGFSLLMGFRVMENFNYPFLAVNINDFWKRWHISLTSWVRDYIYMPVVSKTRNRTIAIILAMVIIGLWHEFSLRYVLWGAYHGAGIAVWQWFGRIKMVESKSKGLKLLFKGISIAITLNFVVMSFYVTSYIYQYLIAFWGN